MQTVIENIPWMGLNITLAGMGLVFGWLYYFVRRKYLAHLFFVLWILFIPNTIYLITDLQHLANQLGNTNLVIKLLLGFEYLILVALGILTFIVGMYPIDKVFREGRLKKNKLARLLILFVLNCLIGFAIVLGKYQRTHSWYIITDPQRFARDVSGVFTEPVLFMMVILFGGVINLTYFAFKNIVHIKVSQKRR